MTKMEDNQNGRNCLQMAGKRNMFGAFGVEYVEFPYFAFKSQKKRDMLIMNLPLEGWRKKKYISPLDVESFEYAF